MNVGSTDRHVPIVENNVWNFNEEAGTIIRTVATSTAITERMCDSTTSNLGISHVDTCRSTSRINSVHARNG